MHLYLCIHICTICTGILSSWPATISASQDNGSVQRNKIDLFIGLLFVYDDGVVDSFHTANSMRSFISIYWISSRAAHAFMLCTIYTVHMFLVCTWCAFVHDLSMCSWCVNVFIVCTMYMCPWCGHVLIVCTCVQVVFNCSCVHCSWCVQIESPNGKSSPGVNNDNVDNKGVHLFPAFCPRSALQTVATEGRSGT